MTREASTLPVNYEEQFAAEASQIAKRISAPSGDRIRIQNNRAIITPDGEEGEELEVVIVDFVSSNSYYEGSFDRDNPQPPGCFAVGPEPTTLQPVDASPAKQADSCATCPHNQFGSAGKGKACKNTRLIAVSPAAWDEEGGDPPVWIMAIPPTSIKSFDSYVSTLASKFKRPPIGVVTKITLDRSVTYAAPRFQVVRPLENESIATVFGLKEEARNRLLTPPDFSSHSPAPKGRGRR